jgi:hypothetical protein
MARIDADLMREARALFARFHGADPTNAARQWRRIAADAPKLKKGRPKGSADPTTDEILLDVYDWAKQGPPKLLPKNVSLIAQAIVKQSVESSGRHIQVSAVERRLRRLLIARGEKRPTQKEIEGMDQAYKMKLLAEALKNPTD